MSPATVLDALIRPVCPIHGVSQSTGISFAESATEQQRANAQAIYDGFNWGGVYPDQDSADFYNAQKILKAKAISDLAFRLGKAPGALTPAEIQAERNRIKGIYDAL